MNNNQTPDYYGKGIFQFSTEEYNKKMQYRKRKRLEGLMRKANKLFYYQISRGIDTYTTSQRFFQLFTKYVEFRNDVPKGRFWKYVGMMYGHRLNIKNHEYQNDKRRS